MTEAVFREIVDWLDQSLPGLDLIFRTDQIRLNWREVLAETHEYAPPYAIVGLGDSASTPLSILARSETIPVSIFLVFENPNFVLIPLGSSYSHSPSGLIEVGDRLYDDAGALTVTGASGSVITLSRAPSGVCRWSDPLMTVQNRASRLATEAMTYPFSEFVVIEKPRTDRAADAMAAILERGVDMYVAGLYLEATVTHCAT